MPLMVVSRPRNALLGKGYVTCLHEDEQVTVVAWGAFRVGWLFNEKRNSQNTIKKSKLRTILTLPTIFLFLFQIFT